MSNKISNLVDRIAKLEHELLEEIREQETNFRYQLEGTRIRFEQSTLVAHRELRVKLLRWLRAAPWRSVVSAPIIYAMIIPLAFLDLTISLYQHTCFRLYRIPRVKRSRYIVLDRHQLAYLNAIEKLNCIYCGYGNGVIAYAREIIARTEQYWCPIKHARKVVGTHRRYAQFLPFGDGENYRTEVLKFREALRDEEPG